MNKCIMRWVVVDNVMISCSSDGEIANSDWDAFCEDLKKHNITRSLGLNLGEASMSSLQRKSASEIAKKQKIKAVVVTENSLVRGVVTALSWFGVTIKGFAWSELEAAFKYLELAPSLEARVKAESQSLKAQVERELAGRRA